MSKLNLEGIEVRDYQKNIADTAMQKNTLVVLPTGMGKTLIAVIIAIRRMEQFPEQKILIMAPTRPLNAQHQKTFEKITNVNQDDIVLITGKVLPASREKIYKTARIVVATPQTIENDLKNERISLENFCFVTFDEAHRAVKDYAYPFIAKKYMLQSKNPLILALTASPGGTSERINETCRNLFIKAVEIRTEHDLDVEKYVKPIDREFVYVDFPEEFKKIRDLLQEVLREDITWLKEKHYIPIANPPKHMLIELQRRVGQRYSETRNFANIWALIRSAEAIKLQHGIELLETQGINFLYDYLKKFEKSEKRTDKRLLKNGKIVEAMELAKKLYEQNVDHPKLQKVREVVNNIIKEKPNAKIIIFANFRATVDKLRNSLDEAGIQSRVLLGQAVKDGKGMTQDEQIKTLKEFADGAFSVLCSTSVGEEGLSISDVDAIIFYEPIPSEIRAIQRRGRTGRTAPGKVIFLITKETRDEWYYFASLKKEKKMKGILYGLKKGKELEEKRNLVDWTVGEN